jgi:hypothetical protein
MIVGGYELTLYCDTTGCSMASCSPNGSEEPTPPFQTYAETGSECRSVARKAGWRLNMQDNSCFCPWCAKKEAAGTAGTDGK